MKLKLLRLIIQSEIRKEGRRMASYVIAAIKSWNIENAEAISARYPEHTFEIITDKAKLTADALKKIDPQYIFFPHWSWIIPEDIYGCFNCVVFHMTDLPFGRGGSPLQNLISRGIYATKISAIRVSGGIDTGDIYDKEPVDIRFGNADQILRKISSVIFHTMIPRFIEGSPTPCKQTGEAVVFKRRTPEQSELPEGLSQRQIYDHIRMLDGEGYPAAYHKVPGGKIYYRNAKLTDGIVYADAEFRRDTE